MQRLLLRISHLRDILFLLFVIDELIAFLFYMLCFHYCCTEGTLWHLQNFLQFIIAEFTPSIMLLYSFFPHFWNNFNKPHFPIYVCVYRIFPPYSPLTPISFVFLTPIGTHLPERTCFAFLFSVFIKINDIFCLFKIAIHGVSLYHFHVYMYYNSNWFIFSIFLLSILMQFLWWFQQV
jgi:hypothetical protein